MASNPGKVSTAQQWRKSRTNELPLPSGNVALLRKPDLREFLEKGSVPDSLQSVVQATIQGKDQQEIQEEEKKRVEEDADALSGYLDFMDFVVLRSVVKPPLAPAPVYTQEDDCTEEMVGTRIPLDDRDQSTLYIDEVDFEDKVAIFEFAIGDHVKMEPFRGEEGESVGSKSAEPEIPVQTE